MRTRSPTAPYQPADDAVRLRPHRPGRRGGAIDRIVPFRLSANQVLVGHQACLEHGSGHTTYTCRACDQTVHGPSLLARAAGVETDRAGRVPVEPDCTLPGHSEVFAIGDMVSLNNLPGVAQPAIREGKYVGRVIKARTTGETVKPFEYFDKGMMATIGYRSAVADAFDTAKEDVTEGRPPPILPRSATAAAAAERDTD